ncbi:peptidase inhibitor family I36 protein [Streptomyces sp. A3M-1-3]|uniref:peptidase inhibitor family I36 protein n=1 Tax=Streptomyces sp. A3M-1-3 TaxID=2962044 RepID=UPI0020B70875|nr:peptidase inhibitor family I36 protein [Streptomyces sp. A3M-1-3]MCP3821226.1 peptidase inhibitor family I36 protein [Streptomyces sp. A3M-1-3]
MRTRTKFAVAATAGAMAVLGVAAPTSASTAPTALESTIASEAKQAGLSKSEVAGLQKQIDKQLATTPGGKQIGVNQIAWRGGKAVMTFPLPGEKKARAVGEAAVPLGSPNCRYAWTCLYEHSNWDGRRLTWSDCNFENLADWGFNDQTTSWHNNQTRGTRTTVYNWTGSSWAQLWQSTAPSSSANVGSANNDKADGLWVC